MYPPVSVSVSVSSLRLLVSPLKPSFSKPARLLPNPPPIFTIFHSSSSPKRRLPVPNQPNTFNFQRNRSSFSSSTLGRQKDQRVPMEETNTKNDKNTSKDVNFRFNRKRAQGLDKSDKPKRDLQLKVRKLNPTNTIAFVQILGTGMDTWDTSPSVLLFFDNQRFIFNAGEGLQRFCIEHKIKLSKIDHVFLSRVCSETAGGIPGLLLTLAGIGEQGLSVNLWGPSDLKYLVEAMKSFIPHAAMVHTRSFGSDIDALQNTNELRDPIVLVEDEVVKISAILVKPLCSEGSALRPGDVSVLYLCELPDIMGKFDPEKAKAFGLRPGPKYSELQSGKPVMSDRENIMVHPSDVMDPSVPGPIVIIVDCPTEAHVQDLLSINFLDKYYDSPGYPPAGTNKTVNCVIHLSPPSVSSSLAYHRWMMKFGSAQHIMAGYEMRNLEIPILKSSARIATRLNYLCPRFFPAPGFWSLQHLLDLTQDSSLLSEGNFSELCKSKSAENLLKFTLRPHLHLGLDVSNIPSLFSPSEVIDELLAEIPEVVGAAQNIRNFWHGHGVIEGDTTLQDGKNIVEEPWLQGNSLPSCLEDIRRDDLELVFLGTGSSQPSKYRNVTSIYLNLFSRGGLLLDCGEGTLGQLKRRYGVQGADDALRNLKGVWISHIHADHHAGLARILALRRDLLKGVAHKPVLVIGPRQLKGFLDAYQRLEDLDMQFIDCRSTTKDSWNGFDAESVSNDDTKSPLFARGSCMQSIWKRPGSFVDNGLALPALESLRNMLSEAGLDALISFPVVHCPQAFGVVLQAAKGTNNAGKVIPGWKIAYSGDTRPCPELVEASRGATILIHEATFEDGLMDEALARNHSTTKEAVQVGEAAGAYRMILTHFSQRYPKVPVFSDEHMHKTCIAFDMMSVNIADLPLLPKVLPYLKLLFRKEIVVDESDDVEDNVSALR